MEVIKMVTKWTNCNMYILKAYKEMCNIGEHTENRGNNIKIIIYT